MFTLRPLAAGHWTARSPYETEFCPTQGSLENAGVLRHGTAKTVSSTGTDGGAGQARTCLPDNVGNNVSWQSEVSGAPPPQDKTRASSPGTRHQWRYADWYVVLPAAPPEWLMTVTFAFQSAAPQVIGPKRGCSLLV